MDGIVDYLLYPVAILGMHPAHKIDQRDFAGSRPSNKRSSGIGGPDLILAKVPFPNAQIDGLRGHTHPFFAFPQRLVLIYQFSNIDTRTDVSSKHSLRVIAWYALVGYPAILVIVSSQAILHNEWLPRIECAGVTFEAFLEVILMYPLS